MSDIPNRWTKATVYPDMWADPAEDPRNTDGTSPDGEAETQLDYIHDYRITLRMKCEGLEPDQLAERSVPPSTLSLLGLLRHMAEVELDWCNWITDDTPRPSLYGGLDAAFDIETADAQTVTAVIADLEREQARTDAEVARYEDLGTRLGDSQIAVRELQIHRIEEYARHCGHADLLRECLDGRTGQ
ncbi:MAG: mycothiol transferase [Brevibacterium sp.]